MLVLENYQDSSPLCSYVLTDEIRNQVGSSNVQFSFLPVHQSVQYTRELISLANPGGQLAGIVAISCPRGVYRLLAESGVPTVVMGSLYAGDPTLPSVEIDNRQAGHLLAQHLVDNGHRRLVLLTPANSRPGDNDFFDGISKALTVARLTHDALVVRCVLHDVVTLSAAARNLLDSADRRTAFIVRSQKAADIVASAVSGLGLNIGRDIEIVFQDQATAETEQSPFVHVQPRFSLEELATLVGRMLKRLSEGLPLEQQRVVIPSELRGVPSDTTPLGEKRHWHIVPEYTGSRKREDVV